MSISLCLKYPSIYRFLSISTFMLEYLSDFLSRSLILINVSIFYFLFDSVYFFLYMFLFRLFLSIYFPLSMHLYLCFIRVISISLFSPVLFPSSIFQSIYFHSLFPLSIALYFSISSIHFALSIFPNLFSPI